MSKTVPDATEHSHQALTELMKADAARQEPLTTVIGAMLEETVIRNDMKQKQSSLPAFTGHRPPLSASAFVTRIAKYSGASPCCYAIGLIYLERMKKRDPGLYLNSTNFQRLFLVSTMTAAKFLDDFYYSNKHWAQIGGIATRELNRLELEFLFRMGFSLHMQREEYDWYAEELLSRVESSPCHAPAPFLDQAKEADSQSRAMVGVSGSMSVCSSTEDEAFLSTHTTPKSSASHLPHDGSYSKQAAVQAQSGVCQAVMQPSLAGPILLQQGISVDLAPRGSFDGVSTSSAAMVHPVIGSGLPVGMAPYHSGMSQTPWVYY